MKYPQGRIEEVNLNKDLIVFNEDQLINVRKKGITIDIRNGHNFEDKAFFLSWLYDWTIILDNKENLCLVPTKKGE